jgi:hypothetical protein
MGEGTIVDTTVLGLSAEGTKEEGGKGADTHQPEDDEGMAHEEVEEGTDG